uniref:Thioredoxin domain-containing protein n=1 Tax=Eucampia antarctica TaxID=49252 RepID=A0A7S2QZE5_9STRA|mmetsp:Transcript_10417/g.10014  ORF Transcript_10417/g.10014 Transcript_10417/m.10014 type:complete len:202 (+) Transcript_10417:190-795(+)|eukprot:CAMPEP_0197832698 /NCGR_PEP_ID=MMETSP1437-20131217/15689_1 /TAXON_ID=49252 ORGANISM="Eucampia antarctica, Strain CCMP1452" /NCGR_SAMPLE_ID=MMETSP1437 /ASSEMBLY_ACC=CAM_ASM_001096 /LENGTH=201 /DNA_ID=CAMNT_0043436205 /DNA_START=188 /DNA_END=793 /DNA_ORIENTATION=-
MLSSNKLVVVLALIVIIIGTLDGVNGGKPAFLSKLLGEKKQYTPLIFFKVPKGQLASSDEMEKMVCDLEKELDVKVERMDVLRDRFARKLYSAIDLEMDYAGKLPLLYHRESRQTIYGQCRNKTRLNAWAKGRLLSFSKKMDFSDAASNNNNDEGISFTADEDEEEMELQREEFERMEEAAMTDLQRRGKDAMKKRMQQKK